MWSVLPQYEKHGNVFTRFDAKHLMVVHVLHIYGKYINRVRSKLKVQNSSTFKDPNCIFQAPKLSTKSHILDVDIQNLDYNVTERILISK